MLVTTKPPFETLVEAHSAELYRYLWRMLGDEAEARDGLQDALLRAYRSYDRVQDANYLRAWLYKIATNVARSQLARNQRRHGLPIGDHLPSPEKAVDLQVSERSQLAAVQRAVQTLPPRQRAALMMRKYQEMDYAEIAAALDCSEETARANVYQALRKLRELFKDEVHDE